MTLLTTKWGVRERFESTFPLMVKLGNITKSESIWRHKIFLNMKINHYTIKKNNF